VILAMLFASIVCQPGAHLFILPIPVPIPAPLFAIGYLAYTDYASRQRGGRINHEAHLAGAVAGIVFAALADPTAFTRDRRGHRREGDARVRFDGQNQGAPDRPLACILCRGRRCRPAPICPAGVSRPPSGR
jgi:hypothetical protein